MSLSVERGQNPTERQLASFAEREDKESEVKPKEDSKDNEPREESGHIKSVSMSMQAESLSNLLKKFITDNNLINTTAGTSSATASQATSKASSAISLGGVDPVDIEEGDEEEQDVVMLSDEASHNDYEARVEQTRKAYRNLFKKYIKCFVISIQNQNEFLKQAKERAAYLPFFRALCVLSLKLISFVGEPKMWSEQENIFNEKVENTKRNIRWIKQIRMTLGIEIEEAHEIGKNPISTINVIYLNNVRKYLQFLSQLLTPDLATVVVERPTYYPLLQTLSTGIEKMTPLIFTKPEKITPAIQSQMNLIVDMVFAMGLQMKKERDDYERRLKAPKGCCVIL